MTTCFSNMKIPWQINKWLLCFFLLIPLRAFSQHALQGKVLKEKTNAPVFAANVFLKNYPATGTATDMEGNFILQIRDEQRSDSLVISSIGYIKKVIPLSSVRWEQVNEYKLQEDVAFLNEIVVTSNRSLAEEFSTKKLDRISIYMSPVSSADPLKAISLLPASTNTSENANPELRGSAGDYSRVILNGTPLYKPVRNSQLNGLGNFSILNTELIASEEVYAGNPPLSYGNSVAGLVEINSRNKLEDKQFKAALSLAGAGLLYSTPISGNSTFLQLFGNAQFSDTYLPVNAGNVPYVKEFDSQDLGANIHYSFSDNLSANTYAYFINEGYTSANLLYNYTGDMQADKTRFFNVFNLKYVKNKTVIALNNEVNFSDSDYAFGNINTNMKESQIYNAVDIRYFPDEKVSLEIGISDDYFNNRFRNTLPYDYYAVYPADTTYSFKHRKKNHNLEGYGYGRYTTEKVVLGAGFRKNIPVSDQEDYLSYQGSFRYNFSGQSSALLSAGRYNGYTVPAFYIQRFDHISAVQYAIEYNYNSANTEAGVALYSKTENAPRYFDESGASLETRQKIKGIEVFLQQQFSRFIIDGSYTWLDSEFTNSNTERERRSYNDMDYLLKLALSYSNRQLLNVSLSYITRPGHYYTPVINSERVDTQSGYKPVFGAYNSQQLGGYSTLDITINKLISWNDALIVPFFTLTNMLSTKNPERPVYSPDYASINDYWHYQERLVYFGVQLSFQNP